jgi:Zn-finger nucleic acid-binding protein
MTGVSFCYNVCFEMEVLMFCPSCLNQPLRASRFSSGLPVNACQVCDGMLIPLTAYRDWVEWNSVEGAAVEALAELDVKDSSRALQCAKCTRLMVKYRVSADTSNRLDFCRHCDEIWLDGGEWQLLASRDFSLRLLDILSDQWQQDIHPSLRVTMPGKCIVSCNGSGNIRNANPFWGSLISKLIKWDDPGISASEPLMNIRLTVY